MYRGPSICIKEEKEDFVVANEEYSLKVMGKSESSFLNVGCNDFCSCKGILLSLCCIDRFCSWVSRLHVAVQRSINFQESQRNF
jgi:hypothetical protein